MLPIALTGFSQAGNMLVMNDADTATKPETSLGSIVAQVRKRLGMSLADVCAAAAQAGHPLSPSVLSRLERGQRWMTKAQADAIEAALGLRLTWTVERVA